MFRSTIITAIVTSALAIVPSVASAGTFFDDGRVSVKEARAETRSLFRDQRISKSEFSAGYRRFDGSLSSVDDPAVRSTKFAFTGCVTIDAKTVDCGVQLAAFVTRKPKGTPYRWALLTMRTTIDSATEASTFATTRTFFGATPPVVND